MNLLMTLFLFVSGLTYAEQFEFETQSLSTTQVSNVDEISCEDEVADWLVKFHSAEKKEEMINEFCSKFTGYVTHIKQCLQGTWSWVEEIAESGHRYDIAFKTCKSVKKNRPYRRVQSCLTRLWNESSYIQDRNERRTHAANECEQELSQES